MNRQRQTGKSG